MTFADHLPILPIAIPALAAPLTLLLMRRHPGWAVGVGFASCAAMLVCALTLLVQANGGVVRAYAVGDWAAPFGIVLVVDRLAAINNLVDVLPKVALTSWCFSGTH